MDSTVKLLQSLLSQLVGKSEVEIEALLQEEESLGLITQLAKDGSVTAENIGILAQNSTVKVENVIVQKVVLVFQIEKRRLAGIPNNSPRSGAARFVGRDRELDRLHHYLVQGDRVAITAVQGMGGVGKTELAIQYGDRHGDAYPGGICWLFCRDFAIAPQIVGYAQQLLGLEIPEGLELADQLNYCWRNWREGDVLFVLDDVTNYTATEPFLPPKDKRFKLLLTTRLELGPPIQPIDLKVLDLNDALALLESYIGRERLEAEAEIASTLCEWLGCLPLGLELVGRYLATRNYQSLSLADMLFRLQRKAAALQGLEHPSLVRDPQAKAWTLTAQRGVEAAFNLSWMELTPYSQHLGKILGVFALAPIPWELVEQTERNYCEERNFNFDEEELEVARGGLLQLHLLNVVGRDTYRLHALIREFFRGKLRGESGDYLNVAVR